MKDLSLLEKIAQQTPTTITTIIPPADITGIADLSEIFNNLFNVIFTVLVIATAFLFLWGAVEFLMGNVENGRKRLLWAAIGLIIA